ncbi:hypothetical protein BWI17_06405 [Betaproteobacteria bacterium GR16-43]|nr:hypothetical protein BWI17_06405 [Betaproteobacteria bacterium GR16-43]
MFLLRMIAVLLLAGSATAFAQRPDGPPPGGGGRPPDIATMLNLDAARAAKVRAIQESTHQKMQALREDTDKQLATVLTAEEMAKLKASRPGPPPR